MHIIIVTKNSQLKTTGGKVMKNLDPKYLAKREARAASFEHELQKPGSVILLGTAAGGVSIYVLAGTFLMVYDMFLKFFF